MAINTETRNNNIHVLFHRTNPWHSPIQCSTKTYAKLFKENGYYVTYFQDIANLGHLLLRKGYYHTWKQGSFDSDGIWVSTAMALLPKLDQLKIFNPMITELSYKSCFPSIPSQVKLSGFPSPDVVWSTIPGSSVLKKLFPQAKLIMNVVDYYPAFHGDRIKPVERYDYQIADHIFVTANTLKHYLVEDLKITANKITILGQGVNIEKYQREYTRPHDLPRCKGPIALWVGVLQKADVELMEAVTREIKKLGGYVILIGPPADWDDSALQDDCVIRLGPKSSEEIPAYLTHVDIGLMLYDRAKSSVYRGQNPLKLYEYLAAGLTVLSTPHDEYEYLNPPVLLITTEDEIIKFIREAIDKKPRFSVLGQDFIINYTWQNCFSHANNIIQDLLLTR